MAKEKKFVQAITSRDEDFAQWYTDVVREGKRSYRRICTGSCMGNKRWS